MRGHLAMLLFSALVAGSFSLGAMAANEIDPMVLAAARFFLAAVVVGVVLWATTGIPRRAMDAPWRYLLMGGLFAFYIVLMFEGLKTAKPVSTSAVFTLTPLMAAGFGYVLLRQRMTRRMGVALGIGAAGALWVIFRADLSALMAFQVGRGEMIFFVGCVAHAIYAPVVRMVNRGESALVFTFGMLSSGFILLALYGAPKIIVTDWTDLPPIVWITLVYTAIFASAGTSFLLQYAALRLPSAKVMAYTYLTPGWVILWEIALGNGAPTGLVLGGIALTFVALWLLLKDETRPVA